MKKLTAILLSCLLLLSLCACGSSSGNYAKDSGNYRPAESMAAPAAAYGGFRDESYAYAADEEAYWDEPAEAPVPAPTEAGGSTEAPAMDPEKIIYSASVNVETTTFDESVAKLEALVSRCGGFVESSSLNGSNYYSTSHGYVSNRSADYVLRIPSARFNELMGSLSELGNIPYSHTYTENITAQYYDVNARLTACRTQEARLLEMMEVAETVEDLIRIEDRLADLRYQIESLQSTLRNWDRQVSYSSVTLTLTEVTVYTPTEEPGYLSRLKDAVVDGFTATGRFFQNLSLGLAELLPLLIVLVVLLLIFLPRIKKGRAARKAKKAAAAQKKEAPKAPAPKEEKAEK